jgi:hypothetical protein
MTEKESMEAIVSNRAISLGYQAECSECETTEFIHCGTNEYEAAVQLNANGWRYAETDDEIGLFCSACIQDKESTDEDKEMCREIVTA